MNTLHICVTSKWFNIDKRIVDHRP
ncbi:tryptophanase leader peptide [Escherichia marmotae]|nr:tryptophanase leader peptide [Escherichia ruysiae]MBY7362955.1 tryptophanase leader peptide [Escherichia ruysiae]MBY7618688.1 tryptophanase leader peptide [Escherichia marmotae]